MSYSPQQTWAELDRALAEIRRLKEYIAELESRLK